MGDVKPLNDKALNRQVRKAYLKSLPVNEIFERYLNAKQIMGIFPGDFKSTNPLSAKEAYAMKNWALDEMKLLGEEMLIREKELFGAEVVE